MLHAPNANVGPSQLAGAHIYFITTVSSTARTFVTEPADITVYALRKLVSGQLFAQRSKCLIGCQCTGS